jgi:hypothetical protein
MSDEVEPTDLIGTCEVLRLVRNLHRRGQQHQRQCDQQAKQENPAGQAVAKAHAHDRGHDIRRPHPVPTMRRSDAASIG